MALELSDVTDRLTSKIGPLPAWAWAAIPATGYVVWSYYRASQDGGTDVVDEPLPEDEYGVNLPDPGNSYLPGYGPTPDGSGNLPYIDPPQYTNLVWGRQAINYLISEGVSAVDASIAISAYINGYPQTVNQTQMNALQKAIQRLGPAPETYHMPTLGPGTPGTGNRPEAPTTVTAVQSGANGAKVSWGPPMQPNGTIIGYQIQSYEFVKKGTGGSPAPLPPKEGVGISERTDGNWVKKGTQFTLGNARNTTFTGLKSKTSYSFRVFARNAVGYGSRYGNVALYIR